MCSLAPHSGYCGPSTCDFITQKSNLSKQGLDNVTHLSSSLRLQFDIDGDGSITSEELRNAMIKLLGEKTSKNEIDAVVREADNNGDGTVDFEGERQRCANTPSGPKEVDADLFFSHDLGFVAF